MRGGGEREGTAVVPHTTSSQREGRQIVLFNLFDLYFRLPDSSERQYTSKVDLIPL